MGFIDSYKRLEKLCSEMYGDNHGLSAYIDEMLAKSHGFCFVPGWNEDLKQLKHYRWVRNQIAHEPGCTEKNMCEHGDAKWLDDFYSRIMNQTDPLTLYAKALKPRKSVNTKQSSKTTSPKQTYKANTTSYNRHFTDAPKKRSHKRIGWLAFLILALLLAAVVYLISEFAPQLI